MIADAHVDILLELAHREHRLGETDVFARTWLPLLEAGGGGPPGVPRLRRPRAPARGLAAGGAAAGDGAPARAPREPGPPRRRPLARRPRRGRARRADRADARAGGRRAVRLRGRDRRSLLGARAADGRTDLEPAQPVRRRRRRRGRAVAARPNAAGAVRRARRRPRPRARVGSGLRRVHRLVRGTDLRDPCGLPRRQRDAAQPLRRAAPRARRPRRRVRTDAASAHDRPGRADDRAVSSTTSTTPPR